MKFVTDSLMNKTTARINDVETILIKSTKTNILPRKARKNDLFNVCIAEGIYPMNLQVAEVKPIDKRGNPNKATNYRPISLLFHFDKIFEKLLFSRLISYSGVRGKFLRGASSGALRIWQRGGGGTTGGLGVKPLASVG